jgi:hypothetical protein
MPMTLDAIAQIPSRSRLYRIAGVDARLVYVGEGAVRSRLQAHLAKLHLATSHRTVFAANASLDVLFIIDNGGSVTIASSWKQT